MATDSERTVSVDTRGVIRHWGDELEGIYGYSPEEAVGRTVDFIIPPALQSRHWRGFDRAIANGALRKPDSIAKVPAVHKDGQIIGVRAILEIRRADDGTVEGFTSSQLGRSPAWVGIAWRAVLAPLQLGELVRRRRGRAHRPSAPSAPDTRPSGPG